MVAVSKVPAQIIHFHNSESSLLELASDSRRKAPPPLDEVSNILLMHYGIAFSRRLTLGHRTKEPCFLNANNYSSSNYITQSILITRAHPA